MNVRDDGILIYEDGDPNVSIQNALYVMNNNIKILAEKIEKLEQEENEELKGTDSQYRVDQKDVADIMNRINNALEKTKYEAVGYDNTDMFLNVLIEKRLGG